jgi:S-(hydroxymethyl)glutathione dehydrogenase/alcohol dehydrogenase
LAMAKRFGATDGVRAEQADSILAQTQGIGVDYAFEAIGKPSVVEAALKVTRRGGTTVALGVGKHTETISLNGLGFPLSGKRLCGCVFGSANPKYDFPRLLELYASGKLDLEGMVTRTYKIDEAAQAFQDLERGVNTRGVIMLDGAAG